MFKIIKIDLTEQKIEIFDGTDLHREFLGGLGVNTKLMADLIPPKIDPFDPRNVLIFGTGSFVGTMLPTAARTELSAMSPLSGRFGTANSGGQWGAHLKFAGYSHVILTGKSPHPVYIIIDDDDIKIEDASHLWGLDTTAAVNKIKQDKGDDFQVASIGPAGEKMVRFASVMNNQHGSWGRTGMGAVMGSKNVKAVAVHGSGVVRVADRPAFSKIMAEAFKRVTKNDHFGYTRRFGSMVVADPYNKIGALPGHNFTCGTFPDWVETRGRGVFEKEYKEKDLACFSCPVACIHWSRVKKGQYEGYEAKGLEVTFDFEFGAKLGIKDIAEIFKCAEICNLYGMDVVSAAGAIAFAIEANQHGLLKEFNEEVPLEWGDFASISKLLDMIGKRQGIGDVLAEGVKRAAAQFPGSAHYAMHIKGVEIPVRDPRGKWDVWTLGNITTTRGGDHLRTRSTCDALLNPGRNHLEQELDVSEEDIMNMDMPADLKKRIFGDPPTKVDIPQMAKYAEDLITIINSTGLCIRPPSHRGLGPDFYARAFSAIMGHRFTVEDILNAAAKIWDLQQQFNEREGEKNEEFAFPERFYTKDLPFHNGSKPPLSYQENREAVKHYFTARGWEFK
ncbi:MAG: aldehyde ferredoxin oxidoreductase family protein [Thermincola sp.]|jgi:aldehyde:ferredoxin oxidoreductase|nr:aldehyde ferredoxin oxidoreductase family protein [Thermincola sp.]MDT3703022.1 aldehyde ferredoxin oxidoreductase family protein [Thermincola sp.]